MSYIPLNDTALNALSVWEKIVPKSDYVFPSPVTGEKLNNVKRSWNTLLKAAEIENFRWHDMRHDFASRLVMAVIASLAGGIGYWRDRQLTRNINMLETQVQAKAEQIKVVEAEKNDLKAQIEELKTVIESLKERLQAVEFPREE